MSKGKKTNTPVLQDWVIVLSWKEQKVKGLQNES